MKETGNNLSEQTARNLRDIILPKSTLISITPADGSFSNYTHILSARSRDGELDRVVVRRYKVFGDYDRGEKARREFNTFRLLNQYKIPAPEALFLDEKGDVLGIPGIVTRFVDGKLIMDTHPSDPLNWARKLARTLARIHSIPCGKVELSYLLDGNAEVAWVVKFDSPPPYMQAYLGGVEIWQLMCDQYPKLETDTPVLLHIDYWTGNILWHENEISAVIDWEEAAYGDPAVDVAYARMNILLMGLPDAADEFLRVYELETGRALKNMAFWELAASVRPMIDPEDWHVDEKGKDKDTFLKFIEDAKRGI